jgi:alpha-L-fucosidase
MEWINEGQKVERYAIEIFKDGKWVSVASGQSIGHKKIDEFAAVTAQRVRLNILSSVGEARIREFQILAPSGGH